MTLPRFTLRFEREGGRETILTGTYLPFRPPDPSERNDHRLLIPKRIQVTRKDFVVIILDLNLNCLYVLFSVSTKMLTPGLLVL